MWLCHKIIRGRRVGKRIPPCTTCFQPAAFQGCKLAPPFVTNMFPCSRQLNITKPRQNKNMWCKRLQWTHLVRESYDSILLRINQTQNMEATKVAGCSTEGGKPEPSWKSQGVQQLCASTKGCVVITILFYTLGWYHIQWVCAFHLPSTRPIMYQGNVKHKTAPTQV